MAWIWLSMALLVMQGMYVGWHMAMIAVDVVMYTWLKNASIAFYFWESGHRWARGGNISRRWRLRRRLQLAKSWESYKAAAGELDTLDGRDAWRSAPGGYPDGAVATAARQLREARVAEDADGLIQLLRTMMQRNHLHTDRPELHTESRVGTKNAIEELVAEQVAALRWLAKAAGGDGGGGAAPTAREDAHAHAGISLSLDDAIEFFERSSVCLGHTALCLSGGGALSM